MLIELRRCNSIGNIGGLLFLVSMLIGKEKIGKSEIRNRCALEYGIAVNCPGAVAFLEYLDLIDTTPELVKPKPSFGELKSLDDGGIIDVLIKRCIHQLISDGIFDKDTLCFNAEKGRLSIKRSAFPLSHAAVRNFLITAGALDKEDHGEICITEAYENVFAHQLQDRRHKLTLEQLLKQQEAQCQRGLEAEKFVLSLEKDRLPRKAKSIKRISDFDVGAGYDIVSFASENSTIYDRYIEVKCYLGSPHFYWSENESDVAKLLRHKYTICLVVLEPGENSQYGLN